METRLASLALVLLLFFSPFSALSGELVHSPLVYSRDQLLAYGNAVVPSHQQPNAQWPCKLRRRRHGCLSSDACRSRRRRCRLVLLSVIIGNVRSVPTKMDELMSLTRLQRDHPECSIITVTETWLTALTPDTDAYLDGFQMWQADRMAESGRRKGGGLAVFVHDR